jgi:chromosome segregation ATPase
MNREINPQLFGPGAGGAIGSSQTSTRNELAPAVGAQNILGRSVASYLPGEVKAVEASVQSVRNQLQGHERNLKSLEGQFTEFVSQTSQRFDRLTQTLMRLEQMVAQSHQEQNHKMAALNGRVNERRLVDQKIQEMVDRHNTVVRNFENRMTHLSRILSEQEMQLHNTHAALEEARQEMDRLKRR